ncbi:MAG: hypothetical protein ABI140_06190 [Jatrophihabitantaceae bacterium]
MSELQAVVASAADSAGAHATAPALLLQAVSALGRLSETTNRATDGGRRPFRIPHSGPGSSPNSPTWSTCWPIRPRSTSMPRSGPSQLA